MTLPHCCYDYSRDLPKVLRGKTAGEGNRTPVCSLGSCRSAIELHPHRRFSILDFRLRIATETTAIEFLGRTAASCAVSAQLIRYRAVHPLLKTADNTAIVPEKIHCHEITSSEFV